MMNGERIVADGEDRYVKALQDEFRRKLEFLKQELASADDDEKRSAIRQMIHDVEEELNEKLRSAKWSFF